jgi:hypothetical protein
MVLAMRLGQDYDSYGNLPGSWGSEGPTGTAQQTENGKEDGST